MSDVVSKENEKLKERTSLLMRVYWQDDLWKIGKDLGVEYLVASDEWYRINHYEAAFEIAKSIDDDKLFEILKSYPKPYGISLGGFQGKHYTLDESGALSLKNSQDQVRNNTNAALSKWGEKAYGVLQALINKQGRSAYFELIDEIAKVLGHEFVPSYLLPRLAPMKLVFKTGSNKYPDWTIPSEIIPVVEGELRKYHASQSRENHKETEKIPREPEDDLLAIERKLDGLVENLVDRKREINIISQAKYKTKFFRDNEKAIVSIKKPCSNEDEFTNRIQWISSIIDDVEIDLIRKSLGMPPVKGSIELIEIIIGEKKMGKTNLTNSLKMVKHLRNKKYPTHPDDGKFIEAMKHFGQSKFPPDWEVLWENVLEGTVKYLTALRDLMQ